MGDDIVAYVDPDFQPRSRPRSCTWPLHGADISTINHEGADGGESTARPPLAEDKRELSQFLTAAEKVCALGGATQRKGISRRNAWGSQSYADLISQAIENSPEKRLTLAQIYDWIVSTVPYFKDKGDCNSSAGWKNSIRHNLSLHSKFQRVNNELTGMSSWWTLNPVGSKSTKAPRHRAASMDNSSKLLKSRMRAKQNKRQAGMARSGEAVGSIPPDGAADSPGPSQQFSMWELPSSSILPRSGLEDPDVWTSFRPRACSNASTLSGRASPAVLGQGDEDQQLEDGQLRGCSAGHMSSTLSEALMEELDLTDGLMLEGRSSVVSPCPAPQAPPKPLYSSAAALSSQVTSFMYLPSRQTPKVTGPLSSPSDTQSVITKGLDLPSSQANVQFSITEDVGLNSSFGSGLFNTITGSYPREAHSRDKVPSFLEVLLTSDSPPPYRIMSLTDPLMPSHDGAGLLSSEDLMAGGQNVASHLTLEKNDKPNSVTTTLQPQRPSQSHLGAMVPGLSQDAAQQTKERTPFTLEPSSQSGELLFGNGSSPASGSSGSHALEPFGGPSCFTSDQERLPMDLDLDTFPENLDWDLDCIINDFMDGEGLDFNFDPLVPTAQDYPGPTTTQASPRSWLPS